MVRILFVDAGNTCRSFMAEHLAGKLLPTCKAESAAIHPGSSNETEMARRALKQHGIDPPHHQPRGLPEEFGPYDVVVALDEKTAAALRGRIHADKLIVWDVPDPFGRDDEVYARTASLIEQLLPGLTTGC